MTNEHEGLENDVADFETVETMLRGARDRDSDKMINFRRFFDQSTQARHFTADEFMVLGPSNSNPNSDCHDKNSLPPENLWPNMVPLVGVMDAIRQKLGRPVRITNCYRASPYNSCVGGVTSSQHLMFKAADFICDSGNSGDWAEVAKAVRDNGIFNGGIGIYRNFVHVDVRGTEATWDKR
ncbi:D-Ala-D-Ala carboxypeptidase family metallohydrolase [Roseobacteraceae bacterium NS-SX3]